MIERDFSSVVTRTINNLGGYAYKIPDTFSLTTGYHSKNPYDIFGLLGGKFLALELKWLPQPQAFNFNRLEEHQIDNLIRAFELMNPNVYAALLIGIDFGRGDKRVFSWSNEDLYEIKDRKDNKKSLLKKEFLSLPYDPIRKGELALFQKFGYPSN